jgi:hypothetical protein
LPGSFAQNVSPRVRQALRQALRSASFASIARHNMAKAFAAGLAGAISPTGWCRTAHCSTTLA